MTNKSQEEIYQRLTERRFQQELRRREKRRLRRAWETHRLQRAAEKVTATKTLKEDVTVTVQKKLKNESRRRAERIRGRSAIIEVLIPETLDMFDQYDQTANLLVTIRRLTLRQRKKIRLDFSESKSIHPSTMICLGLA